MGAQLTERPAGVMIEAVDVRASHRLAALAAAVALLAMSGCSALSSGNSSVSVSTTRKLANLTGMPLATAKTTLSRQGFVATVSAAFSSAAAGDVVSQTPAAGSRVSIGGTIALTVSRGPGVAVPKLVGRTLAAAVALARAHHVQVAVLHNYSSTVAAGIVYQQDPAAGSRAMEHARVVVYLSRGHAPVNVPNLKKLSLAVAEARLRALGLTFTVLKPRKKLAGTCTSGTVLHTFPHPHSVVAFGSNVRIAPCP